MFSLCLFLSLYIKHNKILFGDSVSESQIGLKEVENKSVDILGDPTGRTL